MEPKSREQIESELSQFLKRSKKPLLVVVGPTASGKSKLAVEFAQKFDGEVINADSRQVYEGITIGNALTRTEEMKGISHHLFSCSPLSHTFTISDFKREAEKLIDEILVRNHLPIICGGTFLWIDALVDNFIIPSVKPDWKFRKRYHSKSIEELLEELKNVDPIAADTFVIQPNKRFIIRALEIYHHTGCTKSALAQKAKRQYEVFKVAPYWERHELYERINKRTENQLDNGIVDEVRALVNSFAQKKPEKLLELRLPGLTSIGVKEIIPYLMGKIDRPQLLSVLQKACRHYAKRQLTWLRKDDEVRWISVQ